jgi:hypothetical protein
VASAAARRARACSTAPPGVCEAVEGVDFFISRRCCAPAAGAVNRTLGVRGVGPKSDRKRSQGRILNAHRLHFTATHLLEIHCAPTL